MNVNERCFRLHLTRDWTWDRVAEETGKSSGNAARSAAYRWKRKHPARAQEIEAAVKAVKAAEADALADTVSTDTSVEVDGNELHAVVTSRQIRTLDDLIQAHQIDLDEWQQVGEVEHGVWPTPMKIKLGDGRQVPAVVQNHKVAADFIKRYPEPLLPIPRPIAVPGGYEAPPEPVAGQVRRSLVICDAQFGFRRDGYTEHMEPFHDRRALDLALQLAVALGVDDVDFLGDHNDATEFSTHFDGEPGFHLTTMPAIVEESWWLQQFREALPAARIKMFPGNHEARLRRALNKYLPPALGLRRVDALDAPPLMSWANLLALDDLQIDYTSNYPNEREWRNRNLVYLHSDVARSTPGSTARKILERIKARVVFAHIHREETVTLVEEYDGGKRRVIEATCPGCVCRVDGEVPGSDGWNSWSQGLAVVDYAVEGTLASVQTVPIQDGVMVYDGQLFTARVRTAEIEGMLAEAMEQMSAGAQVLYG